MDSKEFSKKMQQAVAAFQSPQSKSELQRRTADVATAAKLLGVSAKEALANINAKLSDLLHK